MNIRKLWTIAAAIIAGGLGIAIAVGPQAAHAGVLMN
jgi:hypothetical protein